MLNDRWKLFVLGQDVLPLENPFPSFKLFPPRSESIENSTNNPNRASPIPNVASTGGNQLKAKSPTESDEQEFRPINVSPFRLFGTTTTATTPTNSNNLKKCPSTTDKARRKRTPKIDDNSDLQKVKRRKSEMPMNSKQLTLTELAAPISFEKKSNVTPDASSSTTKVFHIFRCRTKQKSRIFLLLFFKNNPSNYREIGFSPVSSAQSDSCSNSNHTSESSTVSSANVKQTQVNLIIFRMKFFTIISLDFRLISAEQSLPIPMNSKPRTVKFKL